MVNRYSVQVLGIVQGVGFRPFVHGLACGLGLGGSVKNVAGHVLIDVEGESRTLRRFLGDLRASAPPLARVDEVRCESRPPRLLGGREFTIEPSDRGADDMVAFPFDVATCPQCLAELFDPSNRRHRHAFINCTNCGPRWTIVGAAPYDRGSTSMAGFPMCPECRSEFRSPGNRRFHAQPICCPACGPRLRFEGGPAGSDDPLGSAIAALLDGKIGAVKGIGGNHLACDARSGAAVAELMRRKGRDGKPLAILVADLAAALSLCEVSSDEAALLASPRRPIVILRRRRGVELAEGVAAGGPCFGVMLPHSPLHHLLIRGMGEAPLVMTSGNASGEPIASDDDDARRGWPGSPTSG